MPKLLNKPITVHEADGRPTRLQVDQTNLHITAITDHWREAGCWWEGEAEKEFYEVEAGGKYLLYRDGERWILYKVED